MMKPMRLHRLVYVVLQLVQGGVLGVLLLLAVLAFLGMPIHTPLFRYQQF
jgi:hypothetical protein